MSSYSQFSHMYSSTPTPLSLPSTSMSTITAVDAPGTGTAGSTGTPCCDTGRPVATDPVTGHVICSCQYDSGRLPVNTCAPRLPAVSAASPLAYGASTGSPLAYGASTGSPLTYGAAAYPSTEHNPYPSIGVDSAAYFSQFAGNPYVLKDGMAADVAMYSTSGYRYPAYDPSLYGYGAPYDLAARRKNATREATGTLKAWLNEHKTNPYPTKGEKIMLAIITKMTLTQVSTWFANARRRLKKENKMTWEPKNKTESEEETDKCSDALENDVPVIDSDKDSSRKSRRYSDNYGALSDKPPLKSECLSPKLECKDENNQEYNEDLQECSDLGKPKIWSLAATAAAKSPSLSGAWPQDRLPAIHPKDEQTLSSSGANTFQLPPTVSSYDYFPPRQSFSQYPVAANASSSSPRNSSSTSCATFSKSGPPIHQDLHVNYQQQSIQGYAGNEIAHVAPVSISGSPANLISNNHTSVPHDLVQPPSVSTDITGLNDTAHTDSNTPVAGQSFHESSLNYRENQIATAGASGIATQSPMMHPSPALLASPSSFLHQTVYHPPNEVLPTSGYPAGVYSGSLANSAQTVSGNQLSTHGHHPSDHHHLQLPEQQQHSHVTSNRDQTGLMTYTQQQFNPIQSHLSSSN